MSARTKVFIGLVVFVVIVFVGILAAPALIDVNHYRPQIEAKLRDKLGRDVSLGPMKLSLIPLAFRVENATVAEDPRLQSGRPFAQIQTLFVKPRLLPLLHRDIEIKSLQLTRPSIELVRESSGVWNLPTIEANKTANKDQTKSTDLLLDQLKIYDGQVAVTDMQRHIPRSVYDHIDIVVDNLALDRSFSADVRAHLAGTGNEMIVWQGKMGPLDRQSMWRTPLDGTVKFDHVSLSGLQRFINAQALNDSDAVLTGNADIKNTDGNIASNGNLEMLNPRIRGVNVGYPITLNYQVSSDMNNDTVAVQKANLRLGQTPISFQGNINAQQSPAQIDLNVQASNASIAEAARLAAAFGTAFNAKTDVSGTVNASVHAQGAATKPALNGQVSAKNVRVSGGDLKEPVQVDAIDLALSPDAIRSNEFTAKTGHTGATVKFNLLDYTSNDPKLDATLNSTNADIQELLRIGKAYGLSGVDGLNGSGWLTLNVAAKGPIEHSEQMVFSGNGAIRNASIQSPEMTKPVSISKAELRFTGNGAAFDDLDFTVGQTTAHGNLLLNDFSAPKVQFSIAANHINVAEWEQLFQGGGQKTPNGDSFINKVTGNGSFTADTVVYDDLKLSSVQSPITLDHGIITMSPLTAKLFNGQQTSKVVVNLRGKPATYSVDSKLDSVDANQLLSAVSPVKQTLYGLLSANADTHFTTAAGARSILPTLTGKVGLNLKNGKIANVDMLHQLATIAQFNNTARAVEPFTQIINLTANFDIQNGVARTNNLKATIDAGSIAASGVVDLAAQKLNLHLTAVLSQPYSQAVGGTGIGGFLNTALANKNGEIIVPVIVTGTFQEPQFAPDLQRVAQMKLENLVPTANDPTGLTKGILGQLFREKPSDDQQQQQQPQQQESNPLNEIFKLIPKR